MLPDLRTLIYACHMSFKYALHGILDLIWHGMVDMGHIIWHVMVWYEVWQDMV